MDVRGALGDSVNAASLAAAGEASVFELLGWDLSGSSRRLFVMLWRLRDRCLLLPFPPLHFLCCALISILSRSFDALFFEQSWSNGYPAALQRLRMLPQRFHVLLCFVSTLENHDESHSPIPPCSRYLFKIDVSGTSNAARDDACTFSMEVAEGQDQLVVKGKVSAFRSSHVGIEIPVCFRGNKDEIQYWAHVSGC